MSKQLTDEEVFSAVDVYAEEHSSWRVVPLPSVQHPNAVTCFRDKRSATLSKESTTLMLAREKPEQEHFTDASYVSSFLHWRAMKAVLEWFAASEEASDD